MKSDASGLQIGGFEKAYHGVRDLQPVFGSAESGLGTSLRTGKGWQLRLHWDSLLRYAALRLGSETICRTDGR